MFGNMFHSYESIESNETTALQHGAGRKTSDAARPNETSLPFYAFDYSESEATNRKRETDKFFKLFFVYARRTTTVCAIGLLVLYFASGGDIFFSGGSSAVCRPCTFKECSRSLCDKQLDPYVCVKGQAHDGCAEAASAWTNNPTCQECCDGTHCDETVPTDADDDIELCPQCTDEQCDFVATKCGLNSYMCLGGAAAGGCSQDKYHWPYSMQNYVCISCCDGRLC